MKPPFPATLEDPTLDPGLLTDPDGTRAGVAQGRSAELETLLRYLDDLETVRCAQKARADWWQPIGLIVAGLILGAMVWAISYDHRHAST